MLAIIATYLVIGIAISFWHSKYTGYTAFMVYFAYTTLWLLFFIIVCFANLSAFLVLLYRTSRNIIIDIVDEAFAVTRPEKSALAKSFDDLKDGIRTALLG
jgi:hypothetical protein